jgi:hypothetical protein
MLGIVCCETWTFPSKLQIAKDWLNKKQEGDEQCLFGTKGGGAHPLLAGPTQLSRVTPTAAVCFWLFI